MKRSNTAPRFSALFRLALLAAAAPVSEATVSNITITNNGFVSPLKPGYSLVEALNFQATSPTLTYSGISFVSENMVDGVGGKASLVTLGGGALAPADIRNTGNTDELFFTETYNNGGTGMRLTLSNLDPTKSYFFETYHGEPRSCCGPAVFSTDKFIDANGSFAVPSYTFRQWISGQ